MADDATDTAFGFIVFILFLALLGAAASGAWPSSSAQNNNDPDIQRTTFTTTPNTTSTANGRDQHPRRPAREMPRHCDREQDGEQQ